MISNTELRRRGGIYIHVPYCLGKCTYCSFYSVASLKTVDWRAFAKSVVNEFQSRVSEADGWNEVTIYIGGGTPSLMETDSLIWMVGRIREIIEERNGRTIEFPEITIEVNPDDVDGRKARAWKDAGINRVSMGVQSMIDTELAAISRRHDAGQVRESYEILRRYFRNISLDLIFGLPGQTLSSLKNTLVEFIRMKPEHISAYSLMYEERSALTRQLQKGLIKEQAEDTAVDMFCLINSLLCGAGYERYEISNYSLPGKRSMHNSSYWEGIPYIGLGPSAHSYDGCAVRSWNLPDVKQYIRKKGLTIHEEEHLSDAERREEMIMTRLRVSEGLNISAFADEFGEKEVELLLKKSRPFIERGYIVSDSGCLILTGSGVMISDEIISSLF